MEKNKNKCRYRITLLLVFIFSVIFSISAASALDNTYYWIPSSGTIGSSGYTANWGSCGQAPTTYRITTLSSTGFICNMDYLTTTSSGDQFLAIYPTAYSSDTTITGKTGATFYLSGEGRTATYRFDLGYAKNGAFTSLGYVTRSASSSGNLYTIDMSSITGTAPSGSYLALKVSVTSSRGGRIYLGTNGGVTGSNSGRFYVSENPLIPPAPSYNVTVTAAPTSANTTNGNSYEYNITVNNIGNTQGNYTLNLVDSDTVNFQSSVLGTTSMQIDSGGSTNTTLTVSAKTNGTIGAIDTTTVTVNSVENPMYTNSTQVSTTIVNTPPPPPTDYKIIVSTDRYSVSSPWNDKPNATSLSENFTAYALLLDNNGKPVSGQGITFKIYSGDGTVKATETSITQANGLASNVPYDAHNDFTGSADADYGTWKIEAYMTNSPTIISSANMELQAGGNTLGGGCKANCHSTNIGTGGKPQSPYTDGYGQTSSRAVAAHKKVNHQSQGCYKCHPGYSEIKTGTYGNTSDVHKNMTCDNCHDTWASFGSSSGTGIPRMPSCYDCHPVSNNNVSIISTLANLAAGNGISVYSYNFDLKKPLAAHNGTMYSLVDSVPCIACHGPAHNISKPYVTSKNNVTENEQCWTCHTNRATTHKSNTNCVGCHTQNAHNISIGGGGPLPPVTYIPADPTNLQNTTSNFWVNNTWLPGIGNTTDSYNVSVNGTWYNGTINTFKNTTTLPHGWVNITVWAYNSSGTGSLSAGSVSQNTQVPNNQPVQAPIGNKPVNGGQLLTFTVSATDMDNDTIAYGTNATKGTLNTTTGQFSWTPGYGDAGVYVWHFNSSDSYGGVASETITVTVNSVPLTITSSSPASDPATIQGAAQSFNLTLNRTANVTWYIDGSVVQTNSSVLSAGYTNSTANAGVYNVTASATDGIDSVSRKWNWTVNAPLPTNYMPPDPINLQNTTGSFWVNHTWQPGSGNITNSYNLSVNGTWYNGTTNTFKNTTAAPHSWVNITVRAYNSSGTGSLSAGSVSQNIQISNNLPVQASIGSKTVNEGQLLTFTVSATDMDNDTIAYGTNATKGTFNTTTGQFSWTPGYGDAGVYVWYFNSSDGYGGVTSETITVTVNNTPLSVTSFSPPSNPTTTQGTAQTFNVTLNRTANVTWYMNGAQVQTDTGTTSASYTNSTAGTGTWNVTASATDGADTVSRTWNWTVNAMLPTTYIPADPTNLQNTTGNFWVNNTWLPGASNITDSYNVSVNGTWHNGTTNTYYNNTVGPHGWVNITVWAYNSSGTGSLSAGSVSQNTQVPNNPPVQAPIGNKSVNEGQPLTFTVSATDIDNDIITYGTNATKGTLNTTTGQFSWTPGYGDAGVYVWYLNSSDNYGRVASETVTVTVNNVPLSVTSSSPSSDPTTIQGTAQSFSVTMNRTSSVTWYMNGIQVQTNASVTSAVYTNSIAGIGTWNVTASATDGIDTASRTWNWVIIAQSTYNLSGYVFDNNGTGLGGVQVQNGSKLSTTVSSGYYLITGLFNGTYNFSYTKAGFNTGYLEVTINGADNTGANKTIYDTMPPAQVTGLANDTPTQTTVNLTWNTVAGANYYQVFRYSASLGYTQNNYWNDTGLAADTLYEYTVRANDSYNNWGQNSSILSIRTAQATDTIPPASVSAPATATGNFYVNNTWTNPIDSDYSHAWFKYSNGSTLQNISKPTSYLNLTWSPHYTQNISAQTVDTSGNVNQAKVWLNVTIPNNAPAQSTIGNKAVDEGKLLSFTISANDADSDSITHGTNATKGSLNTTTGQFSWTPGYGDAGVYTWYFNSSDGYGGLASETITVTVSNIPLSITSFAPSSDPITTQGTAQTFNITLNRTANVTWYMNGTQVQTNTGTTSASYTNSTATAGTWNVTASATDNIDTISRTWNWIVNPQPPANYIPPNPINLQNSSGNFWVNHTWQAGTGNTTDSYNVSVNGAWNNSSINTFKNTTTVPHGWVNITVWAYNSSGTGFLSAGSVSQNTQVPNNPPVQVPIGNKPVNEGQLLTFTVSATDIDNDTITYGTNATKGTLNTTTGQFSWTPGYGDAGVYVWYFNSSDNYGGVASETITVTVNNVLLSVTNSLPASNPTTTVGTVQAFSITLNRTANITWYIDGSIVQMNSSAASANYTNSTAGVGTYNVTAAATDGYDAVSKQWNWTVNPQPVIAPSITSWSNSKTNNNSLTLAANTSETVNFNATANQTITTWNWFKDGVNQSNNYDNFTTSWSTAGTKTIQVNATNNNGTSNTVTWTITILALPATYIPPSPNITSITGNFWVNTTWQPGAGNVTDSYNINVNGAWTNGTANASVNSSLSAHAWQNITVYAYNASGGGSLSASPATKHTQVPNNLPVQTSIGAKSVDEGLWLNFTVHATDVDNDTITYGTNATKGSFNATTGNFSWLTTYSDSGAYIWYFNSSDGYGGVASETITVTVNNTPLSVTSFSPLSDPATIQGTAQTFNITMNRPANVTWYMNGTQVQSNSSVTSSNYTNSTAGTGIYNIAATTSDGFDTVSKQWNWTVNAPLPTNHVPPDPVNLQNTTDSFWVNHTWQPGSGNVTNSYNLSVNGTWYNGTINTFKNTTAAPHGWVNITVWAYNSSGTGSLSPGSISQDTQVANNPPVQASIGNKAVDEGQLLTFKVNATDTDNDTITYGTNVTKGAFNTTTGDFSWIPAYGDAGIYTWYFNSSDGYGGVASETVTVTVNNIPLSITSSVPAIDPTTTVGTLQTFEMTLNRTANISWYIDGSAVQTNSSVTSADYTNSTAGPGIYNVTAIAGDGYDSASKQWNWTVAQQVYIPGIISWSNNKTNNDSLTLAVNTSEPVNFNATANQTITAWNWYQDGVNQVNNYDNFTASWNTTGTKTVKVNATNSNGTSNTITWTVLTAVSADVGPNCLDCHRSVE